MSNNHNNTITITSGLLKGRTLKVPKSAHPMGSRERLALFNSISDYLPEAAVLDLYAGSGALGLEAISRGAYFVYFVEKDFNAAKQLFQTFSEDFFNETSRCQVYPMPVKEFINETKNFGWPFEVILADPPYDDFHPEDLAEVHKLMHGDSIFVLSHPTDAAPEIPGLKLKSTKKYAACHISLFTKL